MVPWPSGQRLHFFVGVRWGAAGFKCWRDNFPFCLFVFFFIVFLPFGFLLFILTANPVSFARFLRKRISSFSGLLTFCSETFLEKLSQLNALRNYGDRWGKLRRVRKHESHPAASLRWLARKIFFWPIRSRQFKRFWNWFGKSQCPGARPYSKLSPRTFYRPD